MARNMAAPSPSILSTSTTVAISAVVAALATLAAYRAAKGRRKASSPGGIAPLEDAATRHAPTMSASQPVRPTPTPQTAKGAIDQAGLPTRSAAPDRIARPDGPIEALLAEDNDVNALVLTRHLEKLGCRVTRAATGADAVAAAGKGAFEIIFMDWRMPEMDGLEAIRHIRRIERYAGVPIVAVTANALPGDRETCLKAGADGYVTKPVDASVLRATLARFGLGPQPAEPA